MTNPPEIKKPGLPATASDGASTSVGGRFSPRCPQQAIKSLLNGTSCLRTTPGIAPESRFEWLEVSHD
jgi:hypothetical protein